MDPRLFIKQAFFLQHQVSSVLAVPLCVLFVFLRYIINFIPRHGAHDDQSSAVQLKLSLQQTGRAQQRFVGVFTFGQPVLLLALLVQLLLQVLRKLQKRVSICLILEPDEPSALVRSEQFVLFFVDLRLFLVACSHILNCSLAQHCIINHAELLHVLFKLFLCRVPTYVPDKQRPEGSFLFLLRRFSSPFFRLVLLISSFVLIDLLGLLCLRISLLFDLLNVLLIWSFLLGICLSFSLVASLLWLGCISRLSQNKL